MKILFISYANMNDTRTNALIRIMRGIGNTISITHAESNVHIEGINELDIVHIGKGFIGNITFILNVISISNKMDKIDILFVDNRRATIPGFIIKWFMKPRMIIYDTREFYLLEETRHVTGKIGCLFESFFLSRSDLIICTNKYRAEAMKKYHKLMEVPFVFENIFKLKYSMDFREEITKQIYKEIINRKRFRIISSSGCDLKRTTDKLVTSMADFKDKADLLLVGGGSEEHCQKIRELISKLKLNNVFVIDKVDKSTLKWLINNCDAGAVIYGQYNQNNKFCASGKIFEFLFEGKPVIASTNPPLNEMCSMYGIGVASDKYSEAINELINNHAKYRDRAVNYINSFEHTSNDAELEKYIKDKVSQYAD